MKKLLKFSSLMLLIAGIALMSCEKESKEELQTDHVVNEEPVESSNEGKKILARKLSSTCEVAFYEQEDQVMIGVDGSIDYDIEMLEDIQSALDQPSLIDVYTSLFSEGNAKIDVPQVIKDLDVKYRAQILETEKNELDDLEDEEMSEPTGSASENKNARIAGIDWDKDATWFKKLVRSKTPGKNELEYIATNKSSVSKSSKGYYHMAFGMAASSDYGAKFEGWWRKCGLFSCSWESHFSYTIKPRYWSLRSWSGSEKRKNRKFRIEGLAKDGSSEKRVHLGVTWSDDRVTTGGGGGSTSNSDLAVYISGYSKNNLSWYVKNTGSTTLSSPWITFTYYGVAGGGSSTDTWQIPATLSPGQTYGDSRYANASSVRIVIDSKGLINESNELNNTATRSNSLF